MSPELRSFQNFSWVVEVALACAGRCFVPIRQRDAAKDGHRLHAVALEGRFGYGIFLLPFIVFHCAQTQFDRGVDGVR